jgi:small subunit ribosomal protein S9
MADDETPDTPAASETPDTPAASETPDTPAASETPDTAATPEVPEASAAEAETPEHAVPSEEAAEIAGAAEDAPLEALQEAQERGESGETPQVEPFEPVPDTAVPTQAAEEIAGVAEDAPLEAVQEAETEAEAQAEAASEAQAASEAKTASEAQAEADEEAEEEEEEEVAPREKPAVPGAHLEVDIVPEGVDPLGRRAEEADPYAAVAEVYEQEAVAEGETPEGQEEGQDEEVLSEPISTAAIDLASGARYRATGKRKTAIARVTLRPGDGSYVVNGKSLEEHFPRITLQRNIRQPLETVGYQERMDVVARLHGGGISAQAGALRHGVSRALLEADPNLRGELKRRGFLTRDSRAKERKKAGLKKARKRPQFSKR